MSAPEDIAGEAPAERWPRTVKLLHPIQFGKELIAELEFRRGILRDLKGLGLMASDMPTIDQALMIASRMCSKPVAALELLQDEDSGEVLRIAYGFFGRSLEAGKTP